MTSSKSLADFYAPLYWGYVAATMLLGTTYIQAGIYFSRSTDVAVFQVLVAVVVVLDTLDTALMSATVYHYFIRSFGDYSKFAGIVNVWWLESGTTCIITATVQIFFATRIYSIMQQYPILPQWNTLLPLLIVITAVGGLGAGLAKMVLIPILASSHDLGNIRLFIATCLEETLAVVSDVITTVTLCYILASTPGGVTRTRSRIRGLFYFILTRGVLVTVVQVSTLAIYVMAPLELYSMPSHLCKSKLYANTLLAMLNSRKGTEKWSIKQTNEYHLSVVAQESDDEDL